MKTKNSAPQKSSSGCLLLLVFAALTCYAAFSAGLDNPYTSVGRFLYISWESAQQKLFFSTFASYDFLAVDVDGQLTCDASHTYNSRSTAVPQTPGAVTHALSYRIVEEPLQLIGLSQPVKNAAMLVFRDGSAKPLTTIDRFDIYQTQIQCTHRLGWLILWFVLFIGGSVLVAWRLALVPSRARILNAVLIVAYLGVVFFCFYIGYSFVFVRATLTTFD